jgi:hypothetical protein
LNIANKSLGAPEFTALGEFMEFREREEAGAAPAA